jgi:hypothetical protein
MIKSFNRFSCFLVFFAIFSLVQTNAVLAEWTYLSFTGAAATELYHAFPEVAPGTRGQDKLKCYPVVIRGSEQIECTADGSPRNLSGTSASGFSIDSTSIKIKFHRPLVSRGTFFSFVTESGYLPVPERESQSVYFLVIQKDEGFKITALGFHSEGPDQVFDPRARGFQITDLTSEFAGKGESGVAFSKSLGWLTSVVAGIDFYGRRLEWVEYRIDFRRDPLIHIQTAGPNVLIHGSEGSISRLNLSSLEAARVKRDGERLKIAFGHLNTWANDGL